MQRYVKISPIYVLIWELIYHKGCFGMDFYSCLIERSQSVLDYS